MDWPVMRYHKKNVKRYFHPLIPIFLTLALCLFCFTIQAQSYQEGIKAYQGGDYEKAFEVWKKAGEKGDEKALYNAAFMLETGQGVQADKGGALVIYQKLALQNHAPSQHKVGLSHLNQTKTRKKGLEWLEKAVKQGYLPSAKALWLFFSDGRFANVNKTQALFWLEKAADLGGAEEALELASMYELGDDLVGEANQYKALLWYKKASELGNRDATFHLAKLYWQSDELDQALQILKPLINQEDAIAKNLHHTITNALEKRQRIQKAQQTQQSDQSSNE